MSESRGHSMESKEHICPFAMNLELSESLTENLSYQHHHLPLSEEYFRTRTRKKDFPIGGTRNDLYQVNSSNTTHIYRKQRLAMCSPGLSSLGNGGGGSIPPVLPLDLGGLLSKQTWLVWLASPRRAPDSFILLPCIVAQRGPCSLKLHLKGSTH